MTGPSLRIALAGNPNTGKTSLFNALTNSAARVGNYPGVTVEKREGSYTLQGTSHTLIDVPGCYSLTARSMDEAIAHDVLVGGKETETVHRIVLVTDATALGRNLYLALQLRDFGRPTVIALNMIDLAHETGVNIDIPRLSGELGMPVIPICATTGDGLDTLKDAIARATPPKMTSPIGLEQSDRGLLEKSLATLKKDRPGVTLGELLWLLSSDTETVKRRLGAAASHIQATLQTLNQNRTPTDTFDRRLVCARYKELDEILSTCVDVSPGQGTTTERIDRFLTHPILGAGVFVCMMFLLFQSIFTGAGPLMDVVETAMDATADFCRSHIPAGFAQDLIVDGLLTGVGNIVIFLPQIFLLFIGIAVLEDTGYMARAAFLLDRAMRGVGLSGKAFVPMMSSFACAIPGIMAARGISNRQDRLVTIMVAPLMSCSARLPVYALVIGALFASAEPAFGFISVGGLVLTAMYFLGIGAAFLMARVFKATLLRAPTPALILELPTYKRPQARAVLLRAYRRGRVFVTQTGPIILVLSGVLWATMTFPKRTLTEQERSEQIASIEGELTSENIEILLQREEARRELRDSYAGRAGRFIEPVIEPLGFDWKIGIGLVGSFAAREVLVSTLGQVYGIGSEANEESLALRQALLADKDPATGHPRFTPLIGVSLMVFFVLAMQCMSTVAVVRRETNSWKWPLLQLTYMNALAWLASFITYQGGLLLGLG